MHLLGTMGMVPIYHYLLTSMNLKPKCSGNFCFCEMNYGKCSCEMNSHLTKKEHEVSIRVCGINKPLEKNKAKEIPTRSDFKTLQNVGLFIFNDLSSHSIIDESHLLKKHSFFSKVFRPPKLVVSLSV
jgi:hypothetical protein